MSYEIYYDRAFIRVGEMEYVPLVNQGSNNCWESRSYGRDVPEKNWQVLNWEKRNRVLFSVEEIVNISEKYEKISQEQGMCFKTRNSSFEKNQFGRWILNGLKSAHTIEEYVSYGNSLYIHDYSGQYEDWEMHPFKTTEEFLSLIEKLKGRKLLNVCFRNNRQVHRPKSCLKRGKIDYSKLPEFYVLKFQYGYLSRLLKSGYRYTHSQAYAKKFTNESTAAYYLKKNDYRLGKEHFTVEKITACGLDSEKNSA